MKPLVSKDGFSGSRRSAYLNTASVALMVDDARSAMEQWNRDVAENGTLSFGGTYTQTAGATLVDAGATLESLLDININGGIIGGGGTIVGNVNITGGGAAAPGLSTGVLTITGDYTQTATGALNIEIGGLIAGDDFDQLVVNGAASQHGGAAVHAHHINVLAQMLQVLARAARHVEEGPPRARSVVCCQVDKSGGMVPLDPAQSRSGEGRRQARGIPI